MNYRVTDHRKRGHKGQYVLFWDAYLQPQQQCEVFSSLRSALDEVLRYVNMPQSIHDAAGRLIAYTKNGRVVMRNA